MKNDLREMTQAEMRKKAPVIFSEGHAPHLSEAYVHIPTYTIIEDMGKIGWKVCGVEQVKARGAQKDGYQKHLVKFFNPDITIGGKKGDDAYPQVLLTNSHDGTNCFGFQIGIFRMICSNGMVVMSEDLGQLKIRHMGYSFEELSKTINEMVEKLPNVVVKINKFKEKQLTNDQIIEFAKKATAVRFSKEDQLKDVEIDYSEFTEATRPEDVGNDLWVVFNRIQEKFIGGDFKYKSVSKGKERKARKIKNFSQDNKINTQLWELAETYL